MKTVLIDGFYLGRGRGVGNYVENLIRNFAERPLVDLRIVVASTVDCPDVMQEDSSVTILRLPRVPFPFWENIVMPLISLRIRPDLIHFPANSSPLLPVYGRRMVTLHDTIFLHPQSVVPQAQVFYQRLGRLYLSFNARMLAHRYTRILTVSECSKNDIISTLDVPSESIAVVYEGPGLSFAACNTSISTRKGILLFGSTDPRKNTKRAIAAFLASKASANGYFLNVVGSGYSVEDHSNDHLSAIRLHGFLSVERLQSLVDETCLLLYPSLYEGFGMPIVEFQRLGIPVLTSSTSACGEIGAQGCIMVDPKNLQAIADGIDSVCFDDNFAAVLSFASIKNSRRFLWKNCAEMVLREYATC